MNFLTTLTGSARALKYLWLELGGNSMKRAELGAFYPGAESTPPATLPYLWYPSISGSAFAHDRPVQNARLLPPWFYDPAALMAEARRTPVTLASGVAQVFDRNPSGVGAPNMREG